MDDFKYYWIGDIFYGYDPIENKYRIFDGYNEYSEYFKEIEN